MKLTKERFQNILAVFAVVVIVGGILAAVVNSINIQNAYYDRRNACVITEYETNPERDKGSIYEYCKAKAREN